MNRKLALTLTLLFWNLAALANDDQNLICVINRQYVCSSENCTAIKPSVTIKLHLASSDADYSRCDKKGCDKYPSSVTQSGIYTLVSAIGKSSVIKLDSNVMSFMETSSSGLSAFIAFGQCSHKTFTDITS